MKSQSARLFVLLTVLAGASCGGGDVIDREVTRAVERTVPGSDKPYSSAVRRDRWSATASWEFEMSMSWAEYREWVVNQLPGFELTRSTDSLLAFVRVLEGDTHTILWRLSSSTHPHESAVHLLREHHKQLCPNVLTQEKSSRNSLVQRFF